ncbi:N-6 DNA methylase [Prosthecobacter sp.]|uniref:Eco57I restriction-modification methylase domain-containing protein n=1 Tax=Prosthecobacter sp. TaxID=1965333 RepID=UPI002488CB36|nr:N-6 DNA methylase [Prosthecobacter sp.]MDI1315519.1 N-6 DNA methylase [Prosthecobacter sp.]
MAVETKPLFNPELIRQQVHIFTLPESIDAARPRLQHWADLISSGKADTFKETALLPEFLSDIFGQLLGYTSPAGPGDSFTLLRETHVEVDGQFADAALGRFTTETKKFIVAVEGKGTRDPLDRPFSGRRLSAVEQAYRYAINLPCDWIIVTSMRETRLYHKGSNQHTYERFETTRLASDAALLKRFVFLLGAERVVPALGESHLNALLRTSESAGRELTNKFYALYADIRQEVFGRLRIANAQVEPHEILRCTQKLLDRILFCSFCEDRVLLPPNTVRHAFEHSDPYNPRPIWENFRGLFRSVDVGNAGLKIPAYNGGLFAHDAGLDTLTVPDEVCALFRDLADYDYRPAREMAEASDSQEIRPVIDVDILGHIFEQSITDLERLRQDLERDDSVIVDDKQAKTRRKKEGAFYTPAFITRYIVEQTLGAVLRARFEVLRITEEAAATGTAKKTLTDPNAYDLPALNEPQRKALIRFWEQWQEVLKTLRILDPACGSGAFLIEAFDQLHAHYEVSNARLEELRGHRTLFDLDRQILQHNIYGVDLNAEAIQICQLSLWIKTAAHGKRLTSLDHSIREGNSVVSDSSVHPKAFDWQSAFPEVFAQGGFDVVVGNPPYVRQELLTPYKPWLEAHYASYHGMADLYVYFYELGQRLLKPGGQLSYIVTNKWMKAGYGEPLRRFFRDQTWIRSVVDFGHAKQIFEEADVFPCIIVAEKPTSEEKPKTARLCTIPREQLRIDDLSVQIEKEGAEMDVSSLGAAEWQLESGGVIGLLKKIRSTAVSLTKYVGSKPITGIKTGLNEAYLFSTEIKNRLINEDPRSAELIKPFFRGSDVGRWVSEPSPVWMLVLKSSADEAWPWRNAGQNAENVFASEYPAIHAHLKSFEEGLRKRQDQGRNWWELRPCAYYALFEQPKIYFQLIQFHPCYSLDRVATYGNNKTGFIPTGDLYLLAVLNSPLMWWHNWRHLPHMKDEALAPNPTVLESIPIALPSDALRTAVETAVSRLIDITASQQQTQHTVLDWLRVEYAIEKPSQKLAALTELDSDAFIAEVKKLRGKSQPLTAASLAALRAEYLRSIDPARTLAAEMLQLERTLSDLINQAYGLTPEEVQLMWNTAPPRMPFTEP